MVTVQLCPGQDRIFYRECYAFLPRDAMHLAVMAQLGIDSIVTTDDDFLPVDGLAPDVQPS